MPNHRYKTSFPKNLNHSRQLTVLTMPYVSLLQDYTIFMTSKNFEYKISTMT